MYKYFFVVIILFSVDVFWCVTARVGIVTTILRSGIKIWYARFWERKPNTSMTDKNYRYNQYYQASGITLRV